MYIIFFILGLIIIYYFNNRTNKETLYFSEWDNIRKMVFNAYGNYCSKCGIAEKLDVHHKIPKSLGGSDNINNLVVLCRNCHEEEHGYHFNAIYKKDRKISSKNMKIINDAIYKSEDLEITYKSRYNKVITDRKIRAMELYKKSYKTKAGYTGYHWMIRSYCYLRRGERNFYIRDIQNIRK